MSRPFELVESVASAAEFHGRDVPEPARPEVWWHRIDGPALVLGSTQGPAVVDEPAARAAGVDVVKRRSGGGAVLLVPGEVTWVDVIVPRGGPGWADDVHTPMRWLGRHLRTAFERLGVGGTEVHAGPLVSTAWSRLLCFDGLGPGELTVDGRKLVGISQRRTRHWARLQTCWYSRYDHRDLLRLLAEKDRPEPVDLTEVAVVDRAIADAVPETLVELLNA